MNFLTFKSDFIDVTLANSRLFYSSVVAFCGNEKVTYRYVSLYSKHLVGVERLIVVSHLIAEHKSNNQSLIYIWMDKKSILTFTAMETGLASETRNQGYLPKALYHDDGDVELKKKRALLADAAEKRR